MTRTEKRLLTRTCLWGTGLTLLVATAVVGGWLQPLERHLSDRRARDFQYFHPPPTERLLHLDIDDPSLDAIGPWPWPRSVLAQIIDEISHAGAKTIALDILFPEPARPEILKRPDGQFEEVDHDGLFAAAVRRAKSVLIPLPLAVDVPMSPRVTEIAAQLQKDLSQNRDQCRAALAASGRADATIPPNTFIFARREAMRTRVRQIMAERPAITLETLEEELLPEPDGARTTSALTRLLEKQFAKRAAMVHLERFSRPIDNDSTDIIQTHANFPPIERFGREIAMTGFVDYDPDPDGVIRSIPTWVACEDRLYPQLGLALACMTLGVNLDTLALHGDRVVIPRGTNDSIIIPVRRKTGTHRRQATDMIMDIPWFGTVGSWETMYGDSGAQHLPAIKVWEIRTTISNIATNNRQLDEAMKAVFALTDKSTLDAMLRNTLDPEDFESRSGRIHAALQGIEFLLPSLQALTPENLAEEARLVTEAEREKIALHLQRLDGMSPSEIDDHLATMENGLASHLRAWRDPEILTHHMEALQKRTRASFDAFLDAATVIPRFVAENEKLVRQRDTLRASLRERVRDRAVLMGWTAMGKVDYKVTPLHARCPGHVIHGVIFNAIMTGHLLRQLPMAYAVIITLLMGSAAMACTTWLTPIRALIAVGVLGGAYWIFNGLFLYDWGGLILDVAGPVSAVVLAWSGCTVFRFVAERRERTRITHRFSSYVDPALVNYVVDHPDQVRLDGQVRELTVVFTDLAGFTTLSERLQERTVPLLNDYMGRMVPIIRKHNGYVNKFLGDGMMFFYGAPQENTYHASDAVTTVLEMRALMLEFNRELAAGGLPEVLMRVGISSGEMVVGDAGSADASDYTVLGDMVNLASRLESANKATGTKIMINDRAAQLVGELFLLRSIGRLRVVGKTQGVMVYEPLAPTERASANDKKLAALSRTVVDTYRQGDVSACLVAIQTMEEALGQHKLTDLYRRECELLERDPPGEGFDGSIVLTEK